MNGLGHQSIKLLTYRFNFNDVKEFYDKKKVDMVIQKLKERIYYLTGEYQRIRRSQSSFKYYKEVMERHGIHSVYDLSKHFGDMK